MSKYDLDTKRHTGAHILATAIFDMFPDAQFGVGPTTEIGFYYDVLLPRTLIPEDLEILEDKMKNIIKQNFLVEKSELDIDNAINHFKQAGQILKVELLADLKNHGTTSFSEIYGDTDTEKKDNINTVSIYKIDNFVDLCRGPHIETTGQIDINSFKLDKISGSYFRGDAKRQSLQRIYGLMFNNKKDLNIFLQNREEAKKRDHRTLGQQLEIFMISEDVGAGLPLYLPNGATVRQLLEKYCYQEAKKSGYQYVYTPHIGKSDLFSKSGHLDHYAEGMFAPIDMTNLNGDGVDENGHSEKFYLKPMNCPMHHQIYLNKPRSYRELPYKLYEYGTVYRYEESGTLTGMIRVRGFTQNDAHVYCETKQLKEVIEEALTRFTKAYIDIGIKDYKIRFSLPDFINNKEKYGEETQEWKESVEAMKQALDELSVDYYEAIGEAAFYGPKIDIQVKNVNGKEDSLSTIQVDYSIAPKFGIKYIDNTGTESTPAIIHMALMGSVDRFMAFMLEMTAGRLPFWLAPTQIKILTVNDQVLDYVKQITTVLDDTLLMTPLKYNEIRYEIDDRSESLSKKIRDAELEKIPMIMIVGPKDIESNQISIRTQGGENKIRLSELKEYIEQN